MSRPTLPRTGAALPARSRAPASAVASVAVVVLTIGVGLAVGVDGVGLANGAHVLASSGGATAGRLPRTGGGTGTATIMLAAVLVATALVCIVPRRRPGHRASVRRDP